MKRTYIASAMLLLCCMAGAQNINQSVQVTNQYESQLGDVRKLTLEVNAPDSLTRFDYKFDYSVFDTEYKGAYEFSPYFIQMKPDPSVYDGRKGYLRAGAGYFLHPELDLVYAPLVTRNSAMSLYARGRGYLQQTSDCDLGGTVGLEGRHIGRRTLLKYGMDYTGNLDASSYYGTDFFHTAGASLGVKSLREGSYIYYDINLDYRFGFDDNFSFAAQSEHLVRVYGSAGPVIRNRYRLLVDYDAKYDRQSGFATLSKTYVGLTPHFLLSVDNIRLDAGVKVDYLKGLRITPHAEVGFNLLRGKVYLFAGYDGGQRMNSHIDLKRADSRYNLGWLAGRSSDGLPGFGVSTYEKMNVYAGLRGHVGTYFQYVLKGGYDVVDDMPVHSSFKGKPVYSFEDVCLAYADADVALKTENVNVSGGLKLCSLVASAKGFAGYAPSLVRGSLDAGYSWNRRVDAALVLEGATERKATGLEGRSDIPGYLDLGIRAGYRFSTRMGFWARGGNLLCQKIQRIPGYVERGPYATLGISLIFY